MGKKSVIIAVLLLSLMVQAYSQAKTGTLKIFTELNGIRVYLDEKKQDNYQEITRIPVGTHYLRVINKDSVKIYGQVISINEAQVTTILIEAPKVAQEAKETVPEKPEKAVENEQPVQKNNQGKTGTLKIFSELTGIVVYLDDIKQGDNVLQVTGVPVGSHYLKVIKDGVSVFGELITINENTVTTVLVKNDGQVAEKIMDSKVKEREEYSSSRLEVLFASNAVTTTKGSSTLFPGYYGYYGFSNSVSNTVQVADFKIVKGGVKEISDIDLATLTNNRAILDRFAKDNAKQIKMGNTGGIMLLGSLLIGGTILADILVKKPFLHKVGTTAPNWEAGVFAGTVVTGVIGYGILNASDKTHPRHYYNVDDAAKESREYNKQLKQKLGLPENFDVAR